MTPEKMRRMVAKRREEKARQQQPLDQDDELARPLETVPVPSRFPRRPVPTPVKNRAVKAAESRMQNRYGRSREEIDAAICREYRTRGPTALARDLGMKVTAVMMRARRMGLSADPHLSAIRRVESRKRVRKKHENLWPLSLSSDIYRAVQ